MKPPQAHLLNVTERVGTSEARKMFSRHTLYPHLHPRRALRPWSPRAHHTSALHPTHTNTSPSTSPAASRSRVGWYARPLAGASSTMSSGVSRIRGAAFVESRSSSLLASSEGLSSHVRSIGPKRAPRSQVHLMRRGLDRSFRKSEVHWEVRQKAFCLRWAVGVERSRRSASLKNHSLPYSPFILFYFF